MQESLEASLVRIRTADSRVVGAGFLVGEHHILTCAHVVSQALGLPDSTLEPPQALVSLDFPLVPPRTLLTASVVQWCPPLSDGRGDIAGLELQGDPPSAAEVVRFAPAEDVWKHEFSVLGFPAGYDDGVWATGRLLRRQATNWIQIEDVKAQGFAVASGFSGTPVWDTQLQGVVGMVVAASRLTETRTAFVIPLDVLAAAWPLLTVPQGQPRNPYKGLRPFTQRDAADFFGREAVVEKVAELVSLLVTEQPASSSKRLLTILGPSGAGKSSLVMAGLLPHLQRGMLPGSETWLCLDPIVPGKHPIESLVLTLAAQLPDRSFSSIREDLEDEAARGLQQLCTHLLNIHRREHPGARVILLVDQFEELFTQTESEDERQHFIRMLLTACSEPRGPLMVLLTLRTDFYDRPMQYPDLFRLIETQHLSLLAIEPGDLRLVVEQPAALPDVQVTFEGDLVNRLLVDVQGQVGALPLLQFTLDQLFQRRSGRQLTLSAYRELGGVRGALTRQAEETYTALPSEEHHKLARALFVRLIDPGATERDTTRRRAALSEFILDDPTQTRLMRETIDAFIAARLLTTNEIAGTTTIEVSHEALIREWPRLAGWLPEARDDIRLQQTISKDATEWERRNKPRDRLYRGSQLKEAKAWARRNTPSGNEVAFLRTSALYRVGYRLSMTAIFLLLISTDGLLVGPYLELKITQLMRAYPTGIPILPTGTPILALLIYDILLSPVVLVAFVCLWAFPLVARFWRKQVKTPTGSNWAFPGTSSQHVVLPPQDPFRLRFALTVGLVGGLVFCGLLLLIRIGVRLSIPEAIRGTYQFRIFLSYFQIVLAALIQATAAGIVVGRVRRLGSQHGLFAAFIGGCVMTVGIVVIDLLFGGMVTAAFIWLIFCYVINAGALLAWPIALIVSVIVHRVVAHVRRIARLRL